jgi:predicted ATP-grasp superfamily ATP-dependent carboligase
MLRTIVADAKAAGNSVTTVLDSQIAELRPPLETDHIISVHSPNEAKNALQEAAETSDATYIVAPETNGTLQRLVEEIEQSNTLSLNCAANAIAQVSDKTRLQQHARKIGLATPETISFATKEKSEDIVEAIGEKLGFPVILKPAESVACEALSIANDEEQAKAAIEKIAKHASNRLMAQKPIQGTPASVTLISNGKEATPITLNEQNISLKTPSQTSTYNGGTTPLNHKLENAAFAAARKLAESIKGLKGYIGVDLILTDSKPVIIEINPRLTTSYIGIRRVIKTNLAQTIMDATIKHKLPREHKTKGYAHIQKVKTQNPTNTTLRHAFTMPELVAPPFPNPTANHTYALICTHALSPQQAKDDFNNAEKHLKALLSGGKHER